MYRSGSVHVRHPMGNRLCVCVCVCVCIKSATPDTLWRSRFSVEEDGEKDEKEDSEDDERGFTSGKRGEEKVESRRGFVRVCTPVGVFQSQFIC